MLVDMQVFATRARKALDRFHSNELCIFTVTCQILPPFDVISCLQISDEKRNGKNKPNI